LFAPPVCGADTNAFSNVARTRDDKSAVVNLAIQAVQQLQVQQQTNLHATMEVARSVASLRRWVLLVGGALLAGMVALFLYERRVLLSLRQRALMPATRPHAPGHAGFVPHLLARGQALLNHRDAAAALACFDEALALEPNNADVHVKRGLALEQLGRFDDALASFDHALALSPLLPDAYVGRGDVLNRLERYEEALACFDQAARLQSKPVTPRPHAPTAAISDLH
jgi:tetratricopeptide (TPR) repeat protein